MAEKFVIGVDLDEVLANLVPHLLDFHNKKYGTRLTKRDVHSYNLWEVWGGTREESVEKVRAFYMSEDFRKIEPVKGSVEGIGDLSREHELVIITARPKLISIETRRWIEKYFPNKFSEIYHTGEWGGTKQKKKPELCQEIGIKTFVEDNIEYARACAEKGIRVFLYDCPWNQSNGLPANVTRVKSWSELLKKLEHSKKPFSH